MSCVVIVCVYNCNSVVIVVVCVHVMVLGCVSIMMCVVSSRHKDWQRLCEAEEAKILCLTKDKQLQTKYKITQANVAQAFPDIRWGDRS